ncbi:hypothetical protein BIW11_06146 [Tropilaelaps mercedesae]|uniref:Uncharacterized protein n=1 Tax=Tropilaelaps mercedesae TaxID=418985 RepID=A0A1V9XZB9_9ACAR|nr:hypothetical protein BIW11_06146 [Tropilaelaps mercedesae]
MPVWALMVGHPWEEEESAQRRTHPKGDPLPTWQRESTQERAAPTEEGWKRAPLSFAPGRKVGWWLLQVGTIPSIPATYLPTQPPPALLTPKSRAPPNSQLNTTSGLTPQQLPPHLDPRPVLIPILSAIIFFPIIAFIIICALRYRAMRLRRKEHRKRLRGGIRGGRGMHVPIPALGERSSYFSQNSSSGETASRQPIGVPSSNRHSSQMSRTTSSLQVPTTSSYQGTHRTSRSTSLSIFEPSFMEDSSDEDKDNEKDGVFEEEPPEYMNDSHEHEHQQQQQIHYQQGGSGGREREYSHTSRISSSSTLLPTAATAGNFSLLTGGGHSAPNSHSHWEHHNKENSPDVSVCPHMT